MLRRQLSVFAGQVPAAPARVGLPIALPVGLSMKPLSKTENDLIFIFKDEVNRST
jgi:hypothetical protein